MGVIFGAGVSIGAGVAFGCGGSTPGPTPVTVNYLVVGGGGSGGCHHPELAASMWATTLCRCP